jgi:hypothetical protein
MFNDRPPAASQEPFVNLPSFFSPFQSDLSFVALSCQTGPPSSCGLWQSASTRRARNQSVLSSLASARAFYTGTYGVHGCPVPVTDRRVLPLAMIVMPKTVSTAEPECLRLLYEAQLVISSFSRTYRRQVLSRRPKVLSNSISLAKNLKL